MKQVFNSTILMILLSGTMHPGISDWNVPWQKVIPYTAGAVGVAFGVWIYKNASHFATNTVLNKLKSQGIYVDDQCTILSIETNGVTISLPKKEINFYYKEMRGSFILKDRFEKYPLIAINNVPLVNNSKDVISTIGIVNPALFYLCAKNQSSLDQWHIFDEGGDLQFKDLHQAQKALDLLVKG